MSGKQKNYKEILRHRRHRSVRKKIVGTADRPRLVVHRSNRNIQAHVVNDHEGKMIIGVSSLSEAVQKRIEGKSTKTEVSRLTGLVLAEVVKSKGIDMVVFDRGGHLYHGRVKALAEGAREGGLAF